MLAHPTTISARLKGQSRGLLLCGHSHLPRIVRGTDELLIVNPGSVGCPAYADPNAPAHVSECGSPHVRYALLSRVMSAWTIDFIAVAYDWNAASMRAAENGRADWAHALVTGFMG